MNDFSLNLALNAGARDHDFAIDIALAPSAGETHDLITGILGRFSEACAQGFLSGSDNPLDAETLRFRYADGRPDHIECELSVKGVDYRAARVLVGMLRGEAFLDGTILSVTVDDLGARDAHPMTITNERKIDLPGRYRETGAYPLTRAIGRAVSERLLRVRFIERPSAEMVQQLIHLQKVWMAVCQGGFATNGREAHTCFVSAPEGYLISPRVFEIAIDMFENPEAAFDPLLNALDRSSARLLTVEEVQIY